MNASTAVFDPPAAAGARGHSDALANSRYRATAGSVYLTGIQALVRLLLDQRRLDARDGLDTAGFVSGYRGSPLGGLDQELMRRRADLDAHRVVFQPGINEDLAATSVWGSQQVGLFPGARYDGVFGLWYGKAPGLDRSSDALRHANAAGTSPRGGVLLVVGDDHGCKSSTMPCASEFALRDLGMPVLAPADVADVLSFGLFGWALSRYAGCWSALIALTDIMDSALSFPVDVQGVRFTTPEAPLGESPHIRLHDAPLDQEARLETKLRRATAFAAANGVNRFITAPRRPRLALVTAGKAYADAREALARLGLRAERDIDAAGIRLVKLGMTWPLDTALAEAICRDAGAVLVVEEKRAFVEERLRSVCPRSRILGKGVGRANDAAAVLPQTGELSAPMIAGAIAELLPAVPDGDWLRAATAASPAMQAPAAKEARKPLYCAGCPHSLSTRVPAGSRAGAGIGCHYMAQWMDRATATVTHMGAEGANWIGQAPFTDEAHIFVNLGDGTYFHSGLLAIRAAVAAGVNVTYKLLFNDAVAMTGGQAVEGPLTVAGVVEQVRAEGVAEVRVLSDHPERHKGAQFKALPRARLEAVQQELRRTPGCTVLVYDQTCATELRRRRKRGEAPPAEARVVINDAVCEGCGDCTAQSSCVAVAPLATEFGTKRTIDQTACNQDLSCLAGFCPAFVTLKGAKPRRRVADADIRADVTGALPNGFIESLKRRLPTPTGGRDAANILVAGVGGTGIVTASQILGTAAHLDGKRVSTLDMTGLAQKGGAVLAHVRISPPSRPHAPTRIPARCADVLLACDLVTAASREVLSLTSPEHTLAIADSHVSATAEFVLGQPWRATKPLRERLQRHTARLDTTRATAMARVLFGSGAQANVLLLGHAWQRGALPLSQDAVERAITLNGVRVEDNVAAFHIGRAAAHDPSLLPGDVRRPRSEAMQPRQSKSLDDSVRIRRRFLVDYQDEALAERYQSLVARVRAAERRLGRRSEELAKAVAEGYFRLLATKDEYEVARLFTSDVSRHVDADSPAANAAASGRGTSFQAKLASMFEPGYRATFHFAPPLLARKGPDGRPRKIAVGGWIVPLLRLLARMRRLRGGRFDPFRFSADRRLERRLRQRFETDYETLVRRLDDDNYAAALELARLPLAIKGFGPVKEAAAEAALHRRDALMAEFLNAPGGDANGSAVRNGGAESSAVALRLP